MGIWHRVVETSESHRLNVIRSEIRAGERVGGSRGPDFNTLLLS